MAPKRNLTGRELAAKLAEDRELERRRVQAVSDAQLAALIKLQDDRLARWTKEDIEMDRKSAERHLQLQKDLLKADVDFKLKQGQLEAARRQQEVGAKNAELELALQCIREVHC